MYDGWILLKKEWPKVSGTYLAYPNQEGEVFWAILQSSGEWYDGCAPVKPTHWRPLPEPPKKKLTAVEELKRTYKEYGTQEVQDYACECEFSPNVSITVNVNAPLDEDAIRYVDKAVMSIVRRGVRGW